jgi:septal ring factor EnvC (AmiA/AmiB activator)
VSALTVGIIAAVVGALLTWLATALPGVRQSREYKRQLHSTIIGIPAAPGVEARPALVDRVVGLEEGVEQAVAIATANNEVVEAVGRQIADLSVSHAELATTLHDHMTSEEAAVVEMREVTTSRQADMQTAIDGVHAALVTHTEDDARVTAEIRDISHEATRHAQAARTAAEAAAEAAAAGALIDQQVLDTTTATHKNLAAISTAVGALDEEAE